MKKLALTAAVLFGTVSMAFAQNTASSSVTINGEVIQGLTIAPTSSTLDLGVMVAGTSPTAVAPNNGIEFTVTGNQGSNITPTFSTSVELYSTADSLTFTPTFVGSSSSAYPGTGSTVTSGTAVQLSTGSAYTAGNYYFWLGGGVGSISPSQTPGSYSGTFTLSVTY